MSCAQVDPSPPQGAGRALPRGVVKHVGRDCELSTTGIDARGRSIPPWEVTQTVLGHIDAAFEAHGLRTWHQRRGWHGGGARSYASGWSRSTDCLRHWAPNGQCFYSDMSHLEVCTAAVRDPRRHAAQGLATLMICEAARARAEETAAPGTRYRLSTANVDPLDPGISWGTHFNVSIDTGLWEQLFVDPSQPATLGFVSSAVAAAMAFFGCGCLLPMRDGSVVYSLAARAHHVSRMSTQATTVAYERGLLNSRREAHGVAQDRLHLIGFDFQLVSAALHACFMQCCLAAAEEGYCGSGLFRPVEAMRTWSWGSDPVRGSFDATAMLVDGRSLTLPVYIRELAGTLLGMCEARFIDPAVAPGAAELLPRIVELTRYMEEGSVERCARHLDWAAKLVCLRQLADRDGAQLGDAESRLVDHDFGNTDPRRGAFWQLWERGLVDPLVDLEQVRACLTDGPPDERGWGRGRLIQGFGDEITAVDWSFVELARTDSRWGARVRVDMPHLHSLNRAAFEPLISIARDVAHLAELLEGDPGATARPTDPIADVRDQLAPPPGAARHASDDEGRHPDRPGTAGNPPPGDPEPRDPPQPDPDHPTTREREPGEPS